MRDKGRFAILTYEFVRSSGKEPQKDQWSEDLWQSF